MQIRVLGHFGLVVPGEHPIAPPRLVAKVGTILAGWPGEWVERDRLICEVWGDRPPRTALNTLQAHVSHLRKVVGKDLVIGDSNGYLLDVHPSQVDAEEFCELIEEAVRAQRHMHLAQAVTLITQALGIWHGDPYLDVDDVELCARRMRLKEMRETAMEDRLACQLEIARDQHELNAVIADARELIALSPLRERGHVLLARSLAAANRVREAKSVLETATDHSLRAGTGVPSGEITELTDALHEHASNIYPLTRATSLFSDSHVAHPLSPEAKAILSRVSELLVENNASAAVLRVETEHHDRIALCLADSLHGDFPRGIDIARVDRDIKKPLPIRPGMLRIVTHAESDDVARHLRERIADGGPTLIITEDLPPAKWMAVTIDVDFLRDERSKKSS